MLGGAAPSGALEPLLDRGKRAEMMCAWWRWRMQLVGSSATTQDFRSSHAGGSRGSKLYPIPLRSPMRRRGPYLPVRG